MAAVSSPGTNPVLHRIEGTSISNSFWPNWFDSAERRIESNTEPAGASPTSRPKFVRPAAADTRHQIDPRTISQKKRYWLKFDHNIVFSIAFGAGPRKTLLGVEEEQVEKQAAGIREYTHGVASDKHHCVLLATEGRFSVITDVPTNIKTGRDVCPRRFLARIRLGRLRRRASFLS